MVDTTIPILPKIITVTVTYGERWQHLEEVIPAIFLQSDVSMLVVVDNASNYDLIARLDQIFPQFREKILVLHQTENLGSAGGFSIGLKKAYALEADFVYLVDDDNLPEASAVVILYQQWQLLQSDQLIALLSYRYRNLPNLKKAAYGQEVRYFHDKPNSFLGFSLTNTFSKLLGSQKLQASNSSTLLPLVQVLQAPYGGLFLPRATITKIGFPNEALFLYADDTEYSYRIIQNGGQIWMVTASRLADLETSWWSDEQTLKKKWAAPLLEEGGFKAYYSTRNLTWFLWKNLSPNPVLFLINGLIYMGYLFLIALVSRKMGAYLTVLKAVVDGLRGSLGKRMKP
jgi:GT2 family glycosyltransferase